MIGENQGTIYEVKVEATKSKGFAVAGQKVTLAIVTDMSSTNRCRIEGA